MRFDSQTGSAMPRCRDCGTPSWNARREVIVNGLRLRVNLHFVCSSCGLMQVTEELRERRSMPSGSASAWW
jgi:hypothetical protein